MITFVVGANSDARNKEVKKLLQKVESVAVSVYDEMTASETVLTQFLGGATLFQSTSTIVLKNLFEDPVWAGFFEERLVSLDTSDHHFIFVEQVINTPLKKKLEQSKARIVSVAQSKITKKAFPLVFTFADAFCSGNKKRAWLLYHELLEDGVTTNEIVPALFWTLKTMAIARNLPNTKEGEARSGMKPFSFKKAKLTAEHFPVKNERTALKDLVSIYHEGHRGADLSALFELFILRTLQ